MPPTAKQVEQQLAEFKQHHPEPTTALQRRCIMALEITLAITREMESRSPRNVPTTNTVKGQPNGHSNGASNRTTEA